MENQLEKNLKEPLLRIEPSDDQIAADYIEEALRLQNRMEAPSAQSKEPEKVNLFVKDESEKVVGGILTVIYRYMMYVETLWIEPKYRKYGYGRQLMNDAEQIARSRGCTQIELNTFNFQAPEFYKRLGYDVFGESSYKEGFTRYYMRKWLK